MMIGGTSITPFETNIVWNYKPDTKLAIKWMRSLDGNYYAIDRTSVDDIYESFVRIYSTESVVNNFIDEIESNRVAGSNIIYLYDLNTGEYIFGADVTTSSQSVPGVGTEDAFVCTAFMEERIQGSLNAYGVSLRLRNLSPSFTGSASLPALKAEIGYSGDSGYTIDKIFSYDTSAYYQDSEIDIGVCEVVCKLTTANMQSFRRYAAAYRGDTIALGSANLPGVDNPFGRRSTSYPYNVKIIDWEDLGPHDTAAKTWDLRVKFAEVV